MYEIPRLSKDLIEQLDETVPDGKPKLTQTEREIFYNLGQRELVDSLKLKLKRQNEKGDYV